VSLPCTLCPRRSFHPARAAIPGGQGNPADAGNTNRARPRNRFVASVLLVAALLGFGVSPAQAQKKRSKVPVLGKLGKGSSQAFSGKLVSLDLERNLLKVSTVQGDHTEIFLVKKGVSVYTAEGDKLKPKELTPGTDVLVYFEVKDERRMAKEIVVLGTAPAEEKSTPPPS